MQNRFKSTYRNFARKPVTSLINLGGFALRLAGTWDAPVFQVESQEPILSFPDICFVEGKHESCGSGAAV